MTDGSMKMGDTGDNMSLPFNMGVLAMPDDVYNSQAIAWINDRYDGRRDDW
jgi:hypothetical protein